MRHLALALSAAAPFATAQQPAPQPAAQPEQQPAPVAADSFGHSRHGEAFDDGPRQRAYLMAGMSAQVHFPVAGLDQAAQAFFDQGITQQHGFWYFEAERSFRQVAQLHPDCAMAYWGMAMANVENKPRAAGFAAHAVQRAATAASNERMWIDALAGYYRIDAACRTELQSGDGKRADAARAQLAAKNAARDEQALGKQLVHDLEAIVHSYPADIEAKAFLAVQIWLNYEWGNGIPITSRGAVDALLDQVFAAAPLHPAHHYRVHLWDQDRPEFALASAATLGHTAPGIAHQWHMGGHIYDKLKRFDDAAWQQEASSRVDHAYLQRDHVMPFLIHNYGHNQAWLCESLQKVGRAQQAFELACNMVELPRHPAKNDLLDRGSIASHGRDKLIEVCTTFEMWDELLRACTGGIVEPGGGARADAERLLALGTAAFRTGDLAAGAAALVQFDALLAQAKHERADGVDRADDEARARKAEREAAERSNSDALKKGTEVVSAVRDLRERLCLEQALAGHDGAAAKQAADGGHGTSAATLAAAHLLAGEQPKALELLQKDKDEHQNQVPPLARLVLLLHAAGEHERCKAAFDELRTVGGHADLSAPLLQRLQPVAAAQGLPADWRLPQAEAADARAGERPPLDELGPFRWQPQPAPGFDLVASDGVRHRLGEAKRPTLVVFYLGFGCLHCVEQLKALAPHARAFAASGIDVVAIGTDRAGAAAAAVAAMKDGERPPFLLLADPDLDAFKAWRCHDDFESMPLHGTFLVDAEGRVRWQDIGFEPFTKIEWLLGESRRLLGMPAAAGSK